MPGQAFLIPHGEARVGVRKDDLNGLTEAGFKGMQKVSTKIGEYVALAPLHLVSSDVQCAEDSADVLHELWKQCGLKIRRHRSDVALREIDFGELHLDQVAEMEIDFMRRERYDFSPWGGESLDATMDRFRDFAERLAFSIPGNQHVAIVSSPHFLEAVFYSMRNRFFDFSDSLYAFLPLWQSTIPVRKQSVTM